MTGKPQQTTLQQQIEQLTDELQEARRQLQISSEKSDYYESLLNNSGDIIYLVEVTKQNKFFLKDVNKAFLESSGLPRQAIINRCVDDIKDTNFRKLLIDKFNTCLQARKKIDYINEYRFLNKKQTCHSVLSPVFNKEGNISQIVGISRDITQMTFIQEKLEETTLQLQSIISTIPDMLWMKDKNGIYITCNKAYEDFLCTDVENIVGKTDYDFYKVHEANNCKLSDEEAMNNKMISFSEEAITYKDSGKDGILEVRKVPVYKKDGSLVGILGIARDIIKQKTHEEQIKEKEQKYRTLIQNADIPIYRYDKNYKRTFINHAVEKLIGKEASDFIGKTPLEVRMIHPDYDEALINSLEKVFTTGEPDSVELLFILPDGSKKYFIHNHAPEFTSNGVIESILAVGHDITFQKELFAREEQYRTLAENSPNIIMRYDRNSKRTYANLAFSNQTGIPYELVSNHKPEVQWGVYLTMLNMSAQEYQAKVQQVIQTGKSENITTEWIRTNDGVRVAHDIHLVAERNDVGEIVGALAIGHDISKIKEFETEVLKQRDFQKIVLQSVAEADIGVHVLENGKFIYTNNENLVKKYYGDITHKDKPNFLDIIHEDDKEKVARTYKKRLAGEDAPSTYNISLVTTTNEIREHEVSVVVIPNTSPIQAILVTKDITERKNIEKRIEFMAHHDVLTGLPNRMLAKDRAEQALTRAIRLKKKIAILFIDLDGFKTINDSLGHYVGDEIIKMVSSRLKKCIRASDTLSRQGGDEFIIILSDVEKQKDVISISKKLLFELKSPFTIGNHVLSISASIGVSLYPEHGDSFDILLQNADAAMYKAKENGKNDYCVFTQQMKHNLIGLFKMQNDLKNAVENQEFVLYYQPQIDIVENRIIGVEALIRWQHPNLGVVFPNDFISIAETAGVIVPIGEWVLKQATKQASVWNQQGFNISVAVNISAIQFQRGNLVEVIQNALQHSSLDPTCLELEFTESVLIEDTQRILQIVEKIKALGVKLSIDDFGTGYSSLAYLKHFAVDKLKIDRSFVKDILIDKGDESIVKTIIQMAKSFNLKSIAEGVEDKEVLDLVQKYGCDEVQGYYFAKPLQAHEFEEFYKNWKN
ncbi:EAL domain-containing protein [Sulfurimonas sp.]|uniref:EAL domain-containing protein n=1 Tax=Sulfurimonas sp. TaxID=2022749 RepID=UPI003D09EC21